VLPNCQSSARASAISAGTILRMSFLVRAYSHAPERPRDRRGLRPLLHWCVWRDDRRRAIRAMPSCWRRPATLRRARPGQCRPGPVEKIRMLCHGLMTRLPATGWTTRRSAISSLPHAQPAPQSLPLGSGRYVIAGGNRGNPVPYRDHIVPCVIDIDRLSASKGRQRNVRLGMGYA
jgi:hypothetical protein